MRRRNFLRDVALAIAASLLPKILQPSIPEVIEETMAVDLTIDCYVVDHNGLLCAAASTSSFELELTKSQYNFLQARIAGSQVAI